MSWNKVGSWLKDNAGSGAALVGSLLTGNVPGAVAAGVSLVSAATGTIDPDKALKMLDENHEALVILRQLAYENEANIRGHIEQMALLELQGHQATQETIRNGDNATDDYTRRTRPWMARLSLYASIGYVVVMELLGALGEGGGASWELAGFLATGALTYMGLRSVDGFAPYSKSSKDKVSKKPQ